MFDLSQPDQFKQLVRASFDTTTSSYGTNGDFHWQFAARLIDHAPLQVGQTVVDVATGTAPAAILAAPIVGASGLIVAVDISSRILRLARHNSVTTGVNNIVFLCGDAEDLPFREQSVDGLLCSSAIVWFPDIPRALHDWHRVLRPQSWIAFSCFGGLARQTVIGLLGRLLKPYGQLLPELNAPLNTPEKCRLLLQRAGYTDITVYRAQEQQLPTKAEDSFAWAWAARSRFNISVSPEQYDQVRARYLAEFTQLAPRQDEWNHDYEQYVVAHT